MVVMNIHKKILDYSHEEHLKFVGFLDAMVMLFFITKDEKELYIEGYEKGSFKNIQVK